MSTTSTDTVYYNPEGEPSTSSRRSSFHCPANYDIPTQWTNKNISKHYHLAQALFSSKQFHDAYYSLEVLITPRDTSVGNAYSIDYTSNDLSPVTKAKSSLRVKVWLLYIKLLDALITMGPNEGAEQLGPNQWAQTTSAAMTGQVWEFVLQYGYAGNYANMEAEVAYFLAQLISSHAPIQRINQECIECYLSAAKSPGPTSSDREINYHRSIILLLATCVLPSNGDLDYAREFLAQNQILTQEQRDESLHMLEQSGTQHRLKEEEKHADNGTHSHSDRNAMNQGLNPRHQMEEIGLQEDDKQEAVDDATASTPAHYRHDSEKDFGIEDSNASTLLPLPAANSPLKPSSKPNSAQYTSPSPIKPSKKSPASTSVYKRSAVLMSNLQRFIMSLTHSASRNPMALLRFVLFLVGIVVALSRRDIKERLKQAMEKVQRTIGMGVKVSYI